MCTDTGTPSIFITLGGSISNKSRNPLLSRYASPHNDGRSDRVRAQLDILNLYIDCVNVTHKRHRPPEERLVCGRRTRERCAHLLRFGFFLDQSRYTHSIIQLTIRKIRKQESKDTAAQNRIDDSKQVRKTFRRPYQSFGYMPEHENTMGNLEKLPNYFICMWYFI